MTRYDVSGLEVEVEQRRCRVNKTVSKIKTEGEWFLLPVQESELRMSGSMSKLAIAVLSYELLYDGKDDLRRLLTKPV